MCGRDNKEKENRNLLSLCSHIHTGPTLSFFSFYVAQCVCVSTEKRVSACRCPPSQSTALGEPLGWAQRAMRSATTLRCKHTEIRCGCEGHRRFASSHQFLCASFLFHLLVHGYYFFMCDAVDWRMKTEKRLTGRPTTHQSMRTSCELLALCQSVHSVWILFPYSWTIISSFSLLFCDMWSKNRRKRMRYAHTLCPKNCDQDWALWSMATVLWVQFFEP